MRYSWRAASAAGARLLVLTSMIVVLVLSVGFATSADAVTTPRKVAAKPSKVFSCTATLGTQNVAYHGGPVMHSVTTHLVYWEPVGHDNPPSYDTAISSFLGNVAAASGQNSNVFALDTQYCDKTGPISYQETYAGTTLDTQPYPKKGCAAPSGTICLKDMQIKAELRRLTQANRLATGLGDLYAVILPPNVAACNSFTLSTCTFKSAQDTCAYHEWSGTGTATIVYAVVPYDIKGCEPHREAISSNEVANEAVTALSHEQNEAITDPTNRGWYSSSGETADKCNLTFGLALGEVAGALYNQQINGTAYYLQQEWSNKTGECAGQPPTAAFSYQRVGIPTGESLSLDATTSAAVVGHIVDYTWTFGDGTSGKGATVSHAYASAGTYKAQLTVEDSNGLTNTVGMTIPVSGTLSGTLVFIRSEGGQSNLWAEKADGTSLKQLTTDGADYHPALSPDGKQVAYEVRQATTSKLWVVNIDGSNAHEIPNAPAGYGPSWSPDGTKIVFAEPGGATIDRINTDGSGFEVLTHGSNPTFPHYSPDGSTIYFSTYSGYYSLWRMNADGSNPTQITYNDQDAYSPAPSPDGSFLAYNSFSERNFEGILTSNSDIYVANIDGTSPIDITHWPSGPRTDETYASWSPDSAYIAYGTERCDNNGATCIYIGDIAHPQASTEIELTPPSWNASEPTWATG
jgi:Tol biopolymer transport system component